MKPITNSEELLILQCRRGGVSWIDIAKLFPRFKDWPQLRFQLTKLWPQGLPPRGMFNRLESLIHLNEQGLLNEQHLYKVLGEQKAYRSYKRRVRECKQWYGIGFTPFIHHSTLSHQRREANG